MPFTPSHVAAVLPFARTPLLPAGLVIGSMVPDLFYFVPVDIPREFSHSPLGAVTLDLGVGALLFALWRWIFRRPVMDLAPLWVRGRFATAEIGLRGRTGEGGMPWAGFCLLLASSLLVGIASHLLWDAATHRGLITDVFPLLLSEAGPMRLTAWLQHGSSVLGTVVVLVWIGWWASHTPLGEPAPSRLTTAGRAIAVAGLVAVGLALGGYYWVAGIRTGLSPVDSTLVFRSVRLTIGAAGLFAALLSLIWWTLPGYSRARSAA
ncbi:hypothetical protein HD599_001155 [Conyzicola lurida]|uniref:DUF4184 family protein n=1 Tax=Conyzicola lurida TaxID=1172621 RepID=A0A841ALJ2_9MICO|nr:DUF4184 family protein [Conyzicola lurida]MBB5842832.1 hypothetical protein [Conyzicola lurida]